MVWRALVVTTVLTAATQTVRVLDRLASYSAPPLPSSAAFDSEPYDYRKRDGESVPSKPIALVEDFCTLLLEQDGSFKPRLATIDEVRSAVDLYATRDWRKLPALRPWTHSNFVRSLSASDRKRLAGEALEVFKSGRITLAECR